MSEIKPNLVTHGSEGEVRDENKVYIVWSYEDILALRPNLSDEQALELLNKCARGLKDSSTETGWEILETLVDSYENED